MREKTPLHIHKTLGALRCFLLFFQSSEVCVCVRGEIGDSPPTTHTESLRKEHAHARAHTHAHTHTHTQPPSHKQKLQLSSSLNLKPLLKDNIAKTLLNSSHKLNVNVLFCLGRYFGWWVLHSFKSNPSEYGRVAASSCVRLSGAGKKRAYTALLQCRTCRKNGGRRGKISVVDMGFPGFHRVSVSTTDLESFCLRPEKFPKRFSFGGGRVRFFLLCGEDNNKLAQPDARVKAVSIATSSHKGRTILCDVRAFPPPIALAQGQ